MTIEEIRAKHESMTLEQLEAEKQARDGEVQKIRADMREIALLLQPHRLKRQREEMVKGAGKPSIVVNTGGLGGPFRG